MKVGEYIKGLESDRAKHIEEYAAAWMLKNKGTEVNDVCLIQEPDGAGGSRYYYTPRVSDEYTNVLLKENHKLKRTIEKIALLAEGVL